jgi:hypothetical protein
VAVVTARSADPGLTPVQSLQKALAGEHAAVYLYGVLGAQSSQSRQPVLFKQLSTSYGEHRAARDQLTVLVAAKGADPVAADVTYRLPGPTGTPAQLVAVALLVEQRLTATYAELVAHTAGSDRRFAIRMLDASALRELGYGGRPSDLPGFGA